MASLSPVTAGRPVGEARFVRVILLPVHQTSHRRVFHDSDHAECSGQFVSSVHLPRASISCKGLELKATVETMVRIYEGYC